MSSYNRTVWQDSLETEITAERLNNMEEGIETANDVLYRPNLFINGNFQIWSNGESFRVQNKDTEVVTPVITADKWYVESIDSTEVLNVTKVNDGLYISSSTPQECAIYQLLDDETYNAIKYKALTLSYEYTQPYSAEDTSIHYETHKEVKKIVAEETLAWEFANNNEIRLPIGTIGGAGCTLHWVKLEVGELNTPCIPDSKDALICNLERRVRKTMHLTITDTVSTWGNINLNIDASDYIVKSIYNSDNIYIALPYVSSSGKWSANIRTNSYGSTDFVCPVGETLTLEIYYEALHNQ